MCPFSPHINANSSNSYLADENKRLQLDMAAANGSLFSSERDFKLVVESMRATIAEKEVQLAQEREARHQAEAEHRSSSQLSSSAASNSEAELKAKVAMMEQLERIKSDNTKAMRVQEVEHEKRMELAEERHSALSLRLSEEVRSLGNAMKLERDKQLDLEGLLLNSREDHRLVLARELDKKAVESHEQHKWLLAAQSEVVTGKEKLESMAARAATAVLAADVAKAEAMALKSESSAIIADAHTQHAALLQGMSFVCVSV
jgi:recombination DNA repair RAD52 pathway protein